MQIIDEITFTKSVTEDNQCVCIKYSGSDGKPLFTFHKVDSINNIRCFTGENPGFTIMRGEAPEKFYFDKEQENQQIKKLAHLSELCFGAGLKVYEIYPNIELSKS